MKEKFKREVKFYEAYDKRNIDPKKDYGIHGVTLKFYLHGKHGVIQFVIYTNWHLKHVQKNLINNCHSNYCHMKPMAADIGYHSYVPMYDGQGLMSEKCEVLGDKPCYYDGSGLRAEEFYDILISGGDEALWEKMENEYYERFKSIIDPQ